MKKTIAGVCAAAIMSISGFAGVAGVATVASIATMKEAHAKRMGGSSFRSSSISRPAARPAPAPAPRPAATQSATPQQSMIGNNVRPTTTNYSRSAKPPVNRTYTSTPAQRASAGSMVQPFLMSVGGVVAGTMLANWLMTPSAHAATPSSTTTDTDKTATAQNSAIDGLNVVKPQVNFKKFEGSDIPAEFQEKMKANGVTVEPKIGEITEYSKSIKVKGGVEMKVDVAELPVLAVYENEAGKLTYDLFMPI